jgi:hypothetical protein
LKSSRFQPKNAFRSWTDIAHGILGFIVGAVKLYLPLGWLLAFTISIAYIVYQSVEAEPPQQSYHNIIEYLTGLALSIVLLW